VELENIKVMQKYLALLRGINVGGKNIIKMADLKAAFEEMGLNDVQTYIQSGNVIFNTKHSDKSALISLIENSLSSKFNFQCIVVLLSREELQIQLNSAPSGFGQENELFRYDVIFLKEPVKVELAIKEIKLREGIDEVFTGHNILFFRRKYTDLSKSKLSKIVTSPIYPFITIRNWNTSTKLLKLMCP